MSYQLHIPNSLIDNKSISTDAVYLYYWLTYLSSKHVVHITHKHLIERMHWNINNLKRLTNCLSQLKDNNHIDYNFNTLPKHNPMEITIIKPNTKYTPIDKNKSQQIIELTKQIDVDQRTIDLKEYAIHLSMVLKYFYKISLKQKIPYAYPNYAKIKEKMSIRNDYIKKIIKSLDNKVIKVEYGGSYMDEYGCNKFESNKYYVYY